MKLLLILGLTLGQIAAVYQSDRRWSPATFRGLTMGKSRRADMLRVLGKPKWSRITPGEKGEEPDSEVWNNYELAGEVPGQVNVVVDERSGVIKTIILYPKKISKQQAIAHFGRDYIITTYDFDPCEEDEDSEPIYESPKGPLEFVEYRSKGIAISIGYGDSVTKISYVAGPIGSTQPRCKQSEAQAKSLRPTSFKASWFYLISNCTLYRVGFPPTVKYNL